MASKTTDAVEILKLLADSDDGMEPEGIAEALGLSMARTMKILDDLMLQTMLDRSNCQYVPGPGALAMASRLRKHFTLEKLARPFMRSLVQQTGEAATLNVYAPSLQRGVCMVVQESSAIFQYAIETGEVKPLHAGASGKAILAFLPEADREAIIASTSLPKVTPRTTHDASALRAELQVVSAQGYVLTRGERVQGAVGIGVPVVTPEQLPGSLVLTIPEYRFNEADATRLIALVKEHAHALNDLFRSTR